MAGESFNTKEKEVAPSAPVQETTKEVWSIDKTVVIGFPASVVVV